MGVTFFADDAPVEFGKFDRALITMYRLTSGDTWVSLVQPSLMHKSCVFFLSLLSPRFSPYKALHSSIFTFTPPPPPPCTPLSPSLS